MYEQRPKDRDLLVPAVQTHEQRLDRTPELVAGDVGFYSAQGEAEIKTWVLYGFRLPITPPRAPSAENTKSNLGSAKDKSGGPVARGQSVYSSGGTVSTLPL